MKVKLEKIRSYAIGIKTKPTNEDDVRDNKMLSFLIITLAEELLAQMEVGEDIGIQQNELD